MKKLQKYLLLTLILIEILVAQNVTTSTTSPNGACGCSCTCGPQNSATISNSINTTTITTTNNALSGFCNCSCSCNSSNGGNNNNNSTNNNNNNSTNNNSGNNNNNSTNSNNNSTNNNSNNSTNSSNNTIPLNSTMKKIAYVDTMSSWWGPSIITDSFGLNSCYDIIILSFWLSQTGGADAVNVYQNIYANLGTDQYGTSNAAVQQSIANLFHQKGKLLFISAFGSTDLPTSQNPVTVANNLATWVQQNPYIDGIDIDYEDNAAVVSGTGITWLISFQKQLRLKLGTKYLITHAPQAPYFSKSYYNNGGYYLLHQQVGNLIDWYNVQFYNQGDDSYDTLTKLFVQSGAPFVGTSYQEIIQIADVPISKIYLGKPATTADVSNTGYVTPAALGQLVSQAKSTLGLQIPGFFIWQLKNDGNCVFANGFLSGYNNSTNINNNSTNSNNNNHNNSTNINNNNNNSTNTNNNSTNTNNNSTNSNSTSNNSTTNGKIMSIAYIDTITSWWGPSVLDQFNANSCYDVIILAFWLSGSGASDALLLYQNIHDYLGSDQFGKNSLQVQQYLSQSMKSQGKKLMISAFGSTDFPTSKDPTQVAISLATYANSLPYIDGIDIDYEDNNAIVDGSGVTWLITFTKALRAHLNNANLILTHAPQAPYFSRQYYTSGAYYAIDQAVGNLINWYNVQFYNQGNNNYNTYQTLFTQSGQWFYGTSYQEIVQNDGIPLNKIVLGKPATTADATNTGYVDPFQLGKIVKQAKTTLNYTIPGFFIWQLSSDKSCNYKNQFFLGYNS